MIKHLLTISLGLSFGLLTIPVWGQEAPPEKEKLSVLDYETPEEYEIGGIEVRGANYTDANGIISISGLTVGNTIRIPGDDIGRAIRKLWAQRLFVNVEIIEKKRVGELLFLEIVVQEHPRYSRHSFSGVKKSMHNDLNDAVRRYLIKGIAATPSMQQNATRAIEEYFMDKGFLDAKIRVEIEEDELFENSVRWKFHIDKGDRIKIAAINVSGNKKVKTRHLYRAMKDTKRAVWYNIFKTSKFIEPAYEDDKKSIIQYYNTIGHRDAQIVKDSVYIVEKTKGNKTKKYIQVDLTIEEGNTYYFGDISFRGNSSYPTAYLHEVLGIRKGDVYNTALLEQRLNFDPNGRDISTLYMDNGYLFFRVKPVEKGIIGDSVDTEIQILEGPIATVNQVIIKGNTRTNEHVIRRELRVLPGDKFSRSAIIRSQRELAALNYFNPETMSINTPVDPQNGTVDVEFGVDERPSDKVELSASWGDQGVIGTAGVTLNNFSLRKLFQPKSWNPLPQGDGQSLSLRLQTNGRQYQSYNISFTEPWLGGKKPTALSASIYHSRQNNGYSKENSNFEQLLVTGASIGIGTRLNWPDDFFISQTTLNYQLLDLNNYSAFEIPTGKFHNLSFSQTFSRNSLDNPIFPQKGSKFSLGMKMTLPYSLFTPQRNFQDLTDAERFKWVEYHKWDFEAEWYSKIAKNFVLKFGAKMGYLGTYNPNVGLSPFERYELGTDDILVSGGGGIQGRDIISLRGYAPDHISTANDLVGSAIYNKFSLELRYLVSPNPNATVYLLSFLEAGNAWSDFKSYNPFDLKRSAGLGMRVYLPMFGTLGFDYGIGFDRDDINPGSKWTDYGRFNIILGIEPK